MEFITDKIESLAWDVVKDLRSLSDDEKQDLHLDIITLIKEVHRHAVSASISAVKQAMAHLVRE